MIGKFMDVVGTFLDLQGKNNEAVCVTEYVSRSMMNPIHEASASLKRHINF